MADPPKYLLKRLEQSECRWCKEEGHWAITKVTCGAIFAKCKRCGQPLMLLAMVMGCAS